MKNFVQAGKHITVTLGADVVSGAGALIGSLFGVYLNTAKSGEQNVLVTEGVIELGKDNSDVAVGDLLYWDNTAKTITKTATSNKKVGVAVEAAGTAATLVKIKLIHTL